MDYQTALKKLKTFDADEILFKEYYYMDKTSQNIQKFIDKYKNETDNLNIVLFPEILPSHRSEDDYIKMNHNVSLVKHPRYVPFYFHEHAYFEMIYVVKGKCTHKLENNETVLKTGDVCILAPNVIHGVSVFDDSIVINILIKKSTFLDIFMNYIRDKSQISIFFLNNIYSKRKIHYIIFHTGYDKQVLNGILDLYIEYINQDEYSDRIICSMLTIFFTKLTRSHNKSIEIPETKQIKGEYENRIISYIYDHYNDITLDQVSRLFHYSVPYCSKIIKDITGYTFSELLIQVRLQKGKNYLLNTQLSIASISERVGYKNPETFIRIFKRYYGYSPSQYRKRNILTQ